MDEKKFVEVLKQRLLIEFKIMDRSGVYGYTQRSMAYNSNKIEGSTLTERQTASLFDTGTFFSDDADEIFRAKDVEEMNGHFKMFNHMLKHLGEPISEEFIKSLHRSLKESVFEDFANGYAVGDWKKRKNMVRNIQTAAPNEVPEKIAELISKYVQKKVVTLKDISWFHAEFEAIHPFQDGNGRVGRMLLLKQCLDANIIPVIIRDENKVLYYRCLEKAQIKHNYVPLIEYFEKEQKRYHNDTVEMLFEYDSPELQKV